MGHSSLVGYCHLNRWAWMSRKMKGPGEPGSGHWVPVPIDSMEEVFQRQITYRWTIKHTLNLRYVKDLPMLLRCSIWLTHSINTAPSSGDLLQLHTGKSTLHSSMTHEITPCILQQDSSDLASNSVKKKKKKVLCGLGYQWRYGLLSLNFFPPDRILYSPHF